MAKYFRWNPARTVDSVYNGVVQKRFLRKTSRSNVGSAVSSYYKIDDPNSSTEASLIHQNKTTGKPRQKMISKSSFALDTIHFTNNIGKRNHCLSEWVIFNTGSYVFSLPLGGYIHKLSGGSTSNVYVAGNNVARGNLSFSLNDEVWATETASSTSKRMPLHLMRNAATEGCVPKSLAGTRFGFYSTRYDGSNVSIYAIRDCQVTYGETGNNSGGYNNIFEYPVLSCSAGEVQTINLPTEQTRVFLQSTDDIIVSVAESGGGDRMMVPPASSYMYTRRTTTKGEWTTGSNATHSDNLVVYSTNTGTPVWATEIADGSGGDSSMGLGIEFLANTFTYGTTLSDYAIIAPFPDTEVIVKTNPVSQSGSLSNLETKETQWVTRFTHNLNATSPIQPTGIFVDGNGNSGSSFNDYTGSGGAAEIASGATSWWFESNNPVYVIINTPSNDEETLLGWMRRDSRKNLFLSTEADVKKYIINPDEDLFLEE